MFTPSHIVELIPSNLVVAMCCAQSKLIVADSDGHIHVLSDNGEKLFHIPGDSKAVWSLTTFGEPDDQHAEVFVSGNTAGQLAVYSLLNGDVLRSFPVYDDTTVRALSVYQDRSTDKHVLVSGHRSGCIAVWDIQNRGLMYHLRGHESLINQLIILDEAQSLISSSYDGTVRVWNLGNGQQHYTLNQDSCMNKIEPETRALKLEKATIRPVKRIAFSKYSAVLAAIQGWVVAWDLKSGKVLPFTKLHNSLTNCHSIRSLVAAWQAVFPNSQGKAVLDKMLLHPSGEAVVTAGSDGAIRIWDLRTYKLMSKIKPFSSHVSALGFYDKTLVAAEMADHSSIRGGTASTKPIYWDLSNLENGDIPEFQTFKGPSSFYRQFFQIRDRLWAVLQKAPSGVEVRNWNPEAVCNMR